MTIEDKEFWALQFKVEEMGKAIIQLVDQSRTQYGMITKLEGKAGALDELKELRETDKKIFATIGGLVEGQKQLKEALSKADDKNLAEAAKAITINVAGGKSDSTTFAGDIETATVAGSIKN
jgi:glutamine amidotransferase PdxT